jgi:predicted nucleotidyltransferase
MTSRPLRVLHASEALRISCHHHGAGPGSLYWGAMEATSSDRPPAASWIGELQRYFAERRERGVASVYLFGSHAAGRAHRESDVDLGVLLRWDVKSERRDRFEVRLRLAGELGRLVAPAEPDIVVLNDAPPLLGRHIVVSGIRIYLADAPADQAYVRDVQLRAADLAPFLRRMRRRKLEWLTGMPPA